MVFTVFTLLMLGRYQRVGSLEVDAGEIVETESPGLLEQLDVENKLYLGELSLVFILCSLFLL